jgi:non-ribosomal peptide synthetase component F
MVQNSNGAHADFIIDKALSDQLGSLCQQEGTTLFMTLLAAFKLLLHRYSGQEDICVGTSIASRQQHELEGMIGFFVNTLALRSEVNNEQSFEALLRSVKTTTLEAYAHQEMPFEKVVEAVVKERDMSRSSLFQVMFVLHNTPEVPKILLGGVELSPESFEHEISKFEITFFVKETAEGLQGSVQYRSDLYNPQTIVRMIGHYQELLRSVVKAPSQKIGHLHLLTVAEEDQLLSEYNTSKVDYPKDKSVTELFELQVEKTPSANALMFEKTSLSYQELNERANQLAHYLRSKGVKEETLVPLCMERGLDMVVAMLAILKAGAAYVAIDTDFPADRISYMVEDSGARHCSK